MNLRPLRNWVVIQPDDAEEATSFGLILPASEVETPVLGTVRAVGSEVTDVKENDRVIFGQYAGTDFDINDEKFLVCKVADILAVVED